MKLFFTIKELYESSYINRYYHEINYAPVTNVSKYQEGFKQLQEKLTKLNSNTRTQALKFLLKEGMDLYFLDFELNSPLKLTETDFSNSFSVLISLETRLKIHSDKEENDVRLQNAFLPNFYEFPLTIQTEEKFGSRVRLLLLNLNRDILTEYFDPEFLKANNDFANSILFIKQSGLLYFTSYEEVFLNDFLKTFEQMPLHKKYRGKYIQFKVFDLIYHLLDYNKEIAITNQKKIKFTEADFNRIHNAKEILRANIEESPTIQQLAKKVGLNEQKLKLGFKQFYSSTVYNYLFNIRMEKAKYLLTIEKKDVTEVALDVGYNSMSKVFS